MLFKREELDKILVSDEQLTHVSSTLDVQSDQIHSETVLTLEESVFELQAVG